MTYAEEAVATRPDHPNGTQALALATAAIGRAGRRRRPGRVGGRDAVRHVHGPLPGRRGAGPRPGAAREARRTRSEAFEAVEVGPSRPRTMPPRRCSSSWPGPRRSAPSATTPALRSPQEEAGPPGRGARPRPRPLAAGVPPGAAGGDAGLRGRPTCVGRRSRRVRAPRPASGLIVGRFCPPHLGHSHLIDERRGAGRPSSWCSSTRGTARWCRGSCGHSGWPTSTRRSRWSRCATTWTPTSVTRTLWDRWIALFRERWP